jgi:gamma-glutamylputrescine oxidase
VSRESHTYYESSLPAAAARPALSAAEAADVCVVGGGLAGLASALALAERGRRVVLLESHHVGWGASGRNGGFVSAGFALGGEAILKRLGAGPGRELYDLSHAALERVRERATRDLGAGDGALAMGAGILVGWRYDPGAGVEAEVAAHAQLLGEDLEFWPRARLRQALATERYHCAVLNRRGFHLNPLAFCRRMARLAELAGVRIHEASPVTAVERRGQGWTVTSGGGAVAAKDVVLTGGGYLGRLVAGVSRGILPICTYVMTTEPLGARLKAAIDCGHAIGDTRMNCDYYRPLADGRLLWGGDITARQQPPRRLAEQMRARMVEVYPQLADAKVDFAWQGTMSYARHRMPAVGAVAPGLWYATGFGGHGMATTTLAGELIGGALAEGDTRYRLLEPFGLPWAGGVLGQIAAQTVYWWHAANEARRERRAG